MRRMVSVFVLAGTFLLWAGGDVSAEKLIAIHGNDKTRDSYIESRFTSCVDKYHNGQQEAVDKNEFLRQCIYNSKLFWKVILEEPKPDLYSLTVEERWSLIPLPFIRVDRNGDRTVGLFVFDSNFLGLKKTLVVGGSASNLGTMYFLMYSDKNVALTDWQMSVSTARSHKDYRLIEGREETDGFTAERIRSILSVGYGFDDLTPRIELVQESTRFTKVDDYEEVRDVTASKVVLGLKYDRSDYKLFYDDGIRASLAIGHDVHRTDSEKASTTSKASIAMGQEAFSNHAILVRIQGGIVKGGNKADAFASGSREGFRGIAAQSAWAEKYANASVGYQVPVRRLSFGVWTVAPFLDYGWIENRGGRASNITYYALGVGTYIYLSKIAVPGLGLEWGHNSKYEDYFMSLSIGFSF